MSPGTGSFGELSWLGNQPAQGGNLLAQVSAPHRGASLSAYVGHDGSQYVICLDQQRRVIELRWSDNAVPVAQVAVAGQPGRRTGECVDRASRDPVWGWRHVRLAARRLRVQRD